jgi:hypothetical protein
MATRTETRTRAAQGPILAAMLLAASALALTLTAAPVLGAGLQDSAGQDASAQADGDEAPRCVTIRTISGYSVIDDRHLIIEGGPSRQYLVTTRQRCSGMRFGVQIGTSFTANQRICQPHMEYIIPDDGWRCLIDTIEEVDSREQAEELIARRAAEAAG